MQRVGPAPAAAHSGADAAGLVGTGATHKALRSLALAARAQQAVCLRLPPPPTTPAAAVQAH